MALPTHWVGSRRRQLVHDDEERSIATAFGPRRPAQQPSLDRPARQHRRWRSLAAGVVSAGAILTAGGCSSRFGAPEPASEQGDDILSLWRVLFLTGLVIGAIVIALILWSVIRYRRRDGNEPATFRDNIKLEVFYTAVPLVIVAVLFGLSMSVSDDVDEIDAASPLVVEVVGFQWGWRFTYPDAGVSVVGDSNRPPVLTLPRGETVRFRLSSPDVVHSFFVNDFLHKRDLVPGQDNEVEVTPNRTGRFAGTCAEYCGLDHTRMVFTVEVVEPAAFQDWLSQQSRQAAAAPAP